MTGVAVEKSKRSPPRIKAQKCFMGLIGNGFLNG